ncbi:deoxyribodipyrimidine photo-lyase [Actinotalea sp. K2]|uniref:cryptochrome/photolyase family protein n=1 Tax=Actinotalea sp. K2 TaxID=2939438 RepID=UPI002017897E|nr:deoxyribodipyrimidine photo-lyase [Actinotalea sp. K2]MCL3863276.1 DNA photolyase family protein [Actinotalea sp. K2]
MTAILWLRRDLRLHDHPALVAAHEAAGPGGVLPVFVADPTLLASAGGPRLAALHDALTGVQESFDGALVIRHGRPEEVLPALVEEVGATAVHISAETTPYGRRRDDRVGSALPDGIPLVATGSPYAVTPGRVLSGGGTPYKVFTPFSRAWREHGWRRPAAVPTGLTLHRGPGTESLPAVPDGVPDLPAVTEAAAHERWHAFLDEDLVGYAEDRNRPDLDATSGLSVHLKYGTIHPRTLLADLADHPAARSKDATTFASELCWREFYADVLWHNPASAWTDLRPDLGGLTYEDPEGTASAAFEAWTQGRTGFPLVDAGMRQLLAEGWVHSRVRMVVASFLVKDLHVWWGHGARWFLAHLRDGDVASNNHGWQWVAGTGTDASPYFRVFNPVLQGERFDPTGDYVRRYVPELAHLAGKAAHQPWKALDGYAEGYPEPIVDHAAERDEALRRYEVARG